MSKRVLDNEAIWALYKKYSDAKRIGWTVKGSRAKDNQTIEVNRAEVLALVDKAGYSEHLFLGYYYLEQLLGAIADRSAGAQLPTALEQYRKNWAREQLFANEDMQIDDATIADAKNAFPNPEILGELEQAVLYVINLSMDKEFKNIILRSLFLGLPKSKPAPKGLFSCGSCGHISNILDLVSQGHRVAFCRCCGQRIY